MSTVVTRAFASTPERDAAQTWREIVELLTRGKAGAARDELLVVTGTVASLIADRAPETAAIVVTCNGPRTRIRCVYDDDAIDGSGIDEARLGFDPLNGDWSVSLPCPADELGWVSNALKRHSNRITARDLSETTDIDGAASTASAPLELNLKGFLGQ